MSKFFAGRYIIVRSYDANNSGILLVQVLVTQQAVTKDVPPLMCAARAGHLTL